MATHWVADHRVGEDSDDLTRWLTGLEGCPPVMSALLARCTNPSHGDEQPTWFYVEGDPSGAIARRRCLACGGVKHIHDSEAHWTHPPMYCCTTCGQSMFEVGAGLHVEAGEVTWMAIGVRCVGCGRLDGLTDMNVPNLTVDEVHDLI